MRLQITAPGSSVLPVLALLALLAAWAAASPPAFGQSTYRCGRGSSAIISDRPCETSGRTQLGAFGNTQGQMPRAYDSSSLPALAKAPDVLRYLSPECAQLNDAMRTGPTRGLKGSAMSELTADYRKRCSEDEQLAHRRMQDDQGRERDQRQQAVASRTAQADLVKLGSEQCHEMLRILAGKRQRSATMNPGEQRDLERFEANHKARCKSG